MMLITTVTKPLYMRFASPCHAWLTIYRFQNRFVYSQLSKRPYHFLDLPLSNHSCCNNLQQSLLSLSVPNLFSMKACNLCNLDFLKDISNNFRPHFGSKLQVYDILQHRKSFNTLRTASNIYCTRKI